MSIRLRDLIKAVRACKTAAEEREVIAKESAALREAFRQQDQSYRHRNVAKLMYIHMLGYPTHFGQMETLKLIAANGFPEKRMGYLGLMILLDERQEVLMLVTNSLKLDMNNTKNLYIVGLALAALGNICSAEMARDLAPDVERLLESPTPYVRKKAALCAIRIVKKVPELLESFVDRAVELLNDRNQAVMLCGVALMLQIVETDPEVIPKYRPYVPALCKVMRTLLQTGMSPEHDIGGITNPFLQVKLLRLLRHLGRGSPEASDAMSDILAQVAANIEGARNAGNAILYEAVQTIMGIESIGGLRVLAVNILGRFLANKDNNIRYVALNTLSKVVAVDTQAVQRHRTTIVDCVKDTDVSIRRRALELVYSLVNEANIRTLTRELLEYLAVSDAEFKPDLTAKICTLIQRFAPDRRWQLDQMLSVLLQAGQYVKEEVCRALVVLITNTTELTGYATRAMFRALATNMDTAAPSLVGIALWCIGEFGEMLLPTMSGALLEGEAPLTVNDDQIVTLLEVTLRKHKEPATREVALTAMMKLTARLPGQVARLRANIARNNASALLEVQTRACEYSKMFAKDKILPALLERMPVVDEADYAQRSGTAVSGDALPATSSSTSSAAAAAGGAKPAAAAAAAAPAAKSGGDLLGLDLLADGLSAAPPSRAVVDDLDALLGGVSVVPAPTMASAAATPAPAAAAAAAAVDLLDLLGGGSPAPKPAAPAAATDSSSLMAILGGPSPLDAPPPAAPTPSFPLPTMPPGAAAAAPATSVTAAGTAAADAPAMFPPMTVWQGEGVSVLFSFTKPVPGKTDITEVLATVTNSGISDVSDFSLQVAVPKYIQLRIEPASGTALPALGSPVTQRLFLQNSLHGSKPVVLRLRVCFMQEGTQVVDTTELGNLPAGL